MWRQQRLMVAKEEKQLEHALKVVLLGKRERLEKVRFRAKEEEAMARGARDMLIEQAEAEYAFHTHQLQILADVTKLKVPGVGSLIGMHRWAVRSRVEGRPFESKGRLLSAASPCA
eukprot:2066124-Rhodomonas_salina.2